MAAAIHRKFLTWNTVALPLLWEDSRGSGRARGGDSFLAPDKMSPVAGTNVLDPVGWKGVLISSLQVGEGLSHEPLADLLRVLGEVVLDHRKLERAQDRLLRLAFQQELE